MQITIQPDRNIDGIIMAPPSKSMAHRAVLCAALAKGTSHIRNLEFSKDIAATLAAAGQLCARVTTGGNDWAAFCPWKPRWTAARAAAPCASSSRWPASPARK